MKRRRVKNSGGETLVETIVAFAVLMVLLTMVTTAVRAGIALNNHAIARVIATEDTAAIVEAGRGTPKGGGVITVTSLDDQAKIGIAVYEAGADVTLRYFEVQN